MIYKNKLSIFFLSKLNITRILSLLSIIIFIQIPFHNSSLLDNWADIHLHLIYFILFLYIFFIVFSFFIWNIKRNFNLIYSFLGITLFATALINTYHQGFTPTGSFAIVITMIAYSVGVKKKYLKTYYIVNGLMLFLAFLSHPAPYIEPICYIVTTVLLGFYGYVFFSSILEIENEVDLQKEFINFLLNNTSDTILLVDSKKWTILDVDNNEYKLADLKNEISLNARQRLVYNIIINSIKDQIFVIKGAIQEEGVFERIQKIDINQYESHTYNVNISCFETLGHLLMLCIKQVKQDKTAEEAQKMTNFTLENVSDILFWVNKENKIIYANQVAAKKLNYDKKDLQEMKLSSIDIKSTNIWKTTIENRPNVVESVYKTKNLEYFPVEITYNKFIFKENMYICAFAKDISKRKRREESFEKIFKHSPIGIFLTDREGQIYHANETFCHLLGYTKKELEAMSLDEVWLMENNEINYHKIRKKEFCEGVFLDKNAQKVELNVISTPFGSVSNKTSRILNIVEDVRYRKKAEKALKLYTKKLEISNKDLEQFAYIVSHDLQEPLRMVTNYLGIIERRYTKEGNLEILDLLSYATDGAKRMNHLILDLLEYSRITTKVNPFVVTDCNEIIINILIVLQQSIAESQAQIVYTDLPIIHGDRVQLFQLFQNLISNAIKYRSQTKPIIHITAKKEGKYWVFCIKDNGIGINKEYKDKIFGVFERLHTQQEYPGTGIGLAICNRIIGRHNGKIWVESTEKEGSSFYFSMPITPKKIEIE